MRREPQADQYHRNHRRRLGTTRHTYPASGPDMLGIWFLVSLRTEYLPAEVTSIDWLRVVGNAQGPRGVPVGSFLRAILLAPIGEYDELGAADGKHVIAASVLAPVVRRNIYVYVC